MWAAFTLIELMVVIAVIAILAALLMPALQRAVDSGKSIRCLSNLKQIMIGVHLYVNDHDGRLVSGAVPHPDGTPMGSDYELLRSWSWYLKPYLGIDEDVDEKHFGLFLCPATKQEIIGYGWNFNYFGYRDGWKGYGWATALTSVEDSSTILIGDNRSPHQAAWTWPYGPWYEICYIYTYKSDPLWFSQVHAGTGNYAFLNGAVRRIPFDDIFDKTVPAYGTFSPWLDYSNYMHTPASD
jgi:prepilin-type N-terminal cleavage/methylation domain-containing protein